MKCMREANVAWPRSLEINRVHPTALEADTVRSHPRWLTLGDREAANSSEASPATLKSRAYLCPQPKTGGIPMTDHISTNSKYPICEHAQRMHDALLVSSFA